MRWLFIILFIPNLCNALEITESYFEFRKFYFSSNMAEIPQYKPKESVALLMDVNLYKPLHWNNRVHGVSTDGQFRLIGWQFYLHFKILTHFEIGWEHHSQHILENRHPILRFPHEDSFLLRIKLK